MKKIEYWMGIQDHRSVHFTLAFLIKHCFNIFTWKVKIHLNVKCQLWITKNVENIMYLLPPDFQNLQQYALSLLANFFSKFLPWTKKKGSHKFWTKSSSLTLCPTCHIWFYLALNNIIHLFILIRVQRWHLWLDILNQGQQNRHYL